MIVVTGATGKLGRLVVEGLKATVSPDNIVAAVRRPEAAADLGVRVRHADYDQPDTLRGAFEGAEKVLLISGNEVGRRLPQHTAVAEAAKQAGARHIVYTSAPRADTSALILAPEHRTTEAMLRESGLPLTVLRNNWYSDNYEANIRQAASTGTYIGSAHGGRIASAPRADYAAGAVVVLTSDGHEGQTYELGGDTGWNYEELAAMIADVTGGQVTHRDLAADEHKAALAEAGLPEPAIETIVGLDGNIADGLLAETTGDLRKLIGRPTKPMAESVQAILT